MSRRFADDDGIAESIEEFDMRTIVMVLLGLLMLPSVTLAHLPKKDHPKIQQHKHDHKMKKAAANCCREQNSRHPNHQHKHHH
jgi:hypothetical protein